MSGLVINATRTGESLAITKRRNNAIKYSQYERAFKEDLQVKQKAHWEINTGKVISRNQIAKLARGIENAEQEKLEARRARLSQLYLADEEGYRAEISKMQETPQQKAQRMVKQARKLKQDREEKRVAFAKEMYNKQWREACDDLRHIHTESFSAYCREQVANQRVEKMNKRYAEQREEEMWARSWENERLKRVEKEEEQKRDRQKFNHETKLAILSQMETTRNQKLNEAYEQELEQEAFRKQMAEDERYAQEKQRENAQYRKEKMDEILRFNEATRRAKAEVAKAQKDQEMRDLQDKIQMHMADLDEQRRQKEESRLAMQDYMAHRANLRKEKKETDRYIERLCQEEQERENAKRDAEHARQAHARAMLQEDVMRGRAQQLFEMQGRLKTREMELDVEGRNVRREAQLAVEEAKLEKERTRAKNLNYQQDIIRQMQETRMKEKHRDAIAFEDRETAIENERRYRAFVEREKKRAEQQGMQIKPGMFNKRK